MVSKLTDQVVIITGAGNGIGLAIVNQLLVSSSISHVVAVDLDTDKLGALKINYPNKLHLVKGDVSQETTNVEAVETAIRQGKRLTSLILNAATFKPLGPFPTLSLANWKRAYDINFFSIVHMLQVAWPHLQETSGNVMITSTRMSQKPCESWTPYASTKATLNFLCGCIPLEDSRIKCVAITPGAVDTQMQTQMRQEDHISKDLLKFLETLKDEGKLLKPEEPAKAFSVLVETGIPESLNGQTVYWEDIVNSGNL